MIENLEQLVRVAADGGEDAAIFKFDADIFFAQIEIAQLHRAGKDGIQVQQLLFGRNLARKAEQIGDEFLGAARLFANFLPEGIGATLGGILEGQQVGVAEDGGKRVIDFVRGAGGQLAQRRELFGLNEMGLETLDVFERIPKIVNQLSAFLIDQVLAQENQRADDKNRGQGHQHSEFPDRDGRIAELQVPNRQQRSRQAADTGQTRGPLGIALDWRGHGLRLKFQIARDDAGDADPDKGAKHGQTEQISVVGNYAAHGEVEDKNSGDVQGRGAEEMAVNLAPGALGAKEQNSEADRDHQIFDEICGNIARMKQRWFGLNAFPGHGRENINIEPDDSEQQQIDQAEAKCLAHFPGVGHERDGGHERNGVQKKEQIRGEGRLSLVLQAKLGVNNDENSGEPKRAAQGQ